MSLKVTFAIATAIMLAGLVPLSATQNQETASPVDLARLVTDKPAEEAGVIAGKLLTEAIRLGGTDREVLRRVSITTAVLMAGVAAESRDIQVAVAGALLAAADEAYAPPVAATIARVLQRHVDDWEDLLDDALLAVAEARRAQVARAADSPRRTLGLRLHWTVTDYADDVVAMLIEEPVEDLDDALIAILPTTTTTTTTTTRPSPTPVGRR